MHRDSTPAMTAAESVPSAPLPAPQLRAVFAFQRARTCASETETELGSFAEDLYGSALDGSVF